MKIDISDVQRRYEKMSDEEFVLVKRADLLPEVQTIYDQEQARRSTPEWLALHPKPEPIPPPPAAPATLRKEIKKQIKQEAREAWKAQVRSSFWLSWREFAAVVVAVICVMSLSALLLGSGAGVKLAAILGTGGGLYTANFFKRREAEKRRIETEIEQRYRDSGDAQIYNTNTLAHRAGAWVGRVIADRKKQSN